MEGYSQSVELYQGQAFRTYQAWSTKYETEVIIKEYQRSGILSSESLLKEAVRQAREKSNKSATLIEVVLSPLNESGTDEAFCVNFVLKKKQMDVARTIIERDDSRGQWAPGLTGYEIRCNLFTRNDMHIRKRVDLAYSTLLKKEVVIKSRECYKVLQMNELVAEAFTLAYVEHPNNCQLIDVCITNELNKRFRINLVMEKLKCVNDDIFERNQLGTPYTEAELLKFLQDIARGLEHSKSFVRFTQGIAHRDIKPANVFISENGVFKLGDYGSAWKKTTHTKTISAMGSEDYMAPEMRACMANPVHQVDPFFADIYSLGMTLFHMAAFNLPTASLEEAIQALTYSKRFKELLIWMTKVDIRRRMQLSHVIAICEDLIAAAPVEIKQQREEPPAAMKLPSAGTPPRADVRSSKPTETVEGATPFRQPCIQGTLFRLAFDSQNRVDGRLQVLNVGSKKWAPPQSPTLRMEVDYATCYVFATETAVVLCGSKLQLGNKECAFYAAGASVYRVEFAGSRPTVTVLPSFPERRVLAGLYVHEENLYAFGG